MGINPNHGDTDALAAAELGEWDAAADRDGGALIVDVEGFEGPLDLLLSLARDQKVDLARISILALAEQYLAFITAARELRIELAADYLVMAAWLAYLKSRLLLPVTETSDEPSGQELATLLAFRLRRLDAMRQAAARLMARDRLHRDVFPRGQPEGIRVERTSAYADNLYDLLKAYAQRRQRQARARVRFARLPVISIKEARQRLERLLGRMDDWGRLDVYLAEYLAEPGTRTTTLASSFTASLEMVREGIVEVRQERPFAPIYMRRRVRA